VAADIGMARSVVIVLLHGLELTSPLDDSSGILHNSVDYLIPVPFITFGIVTVTAF